MINKRAMSGTGNRNIPSSQVSSNAHMNQAPYDRMKYPQKAETAPAQYQNQASDRGTFTQKQAPGSA